MSNKRCQWVCILWYAFATSNGLVMNKKKTNYHHHTIIFENARWKKLYTRKSLKCNQNKHSEFERIFSHFYVRQEAYVIRLQQRRQLHRTKKRKNSLFGMVWKSLTSNCLFTCCYFRHLEKNLFSSTVKKIYIKNHF